LFENVSPRPRAKNVSTSTSSLPVPPIQLKAVQAAVATSTSSLAQTMQEAPTLERSVATVDPRCSWSGTVQLGSSVASLRSSEARAQESQISPERTPSASADLQNGQLGSRLSIQSSMLSGSQPRSRSGRERQGSHVNSEPEVASATDRPVPPPEGRGDSDAETVRAAPGVPRSESSVSSVETERLRLSPEARAGHRSDVPRIDATILSYPSLTDRSDWGGTASSTPRLRKPGESTPRASRWTAEDDYQEDDETLRILRKYVSNGQRGTSNVAKVR
jgi:hypothetical protein